MLLIDLDRDSLIETRWPVASKVIDNETHPAGAVNHRTTQAGCSLKQCNRCVSMRCQGLETKPHRMMILISVALCSNH